GRGGVARLLGSAAHRPLPPVDPLRHRRGHAVLAGWRLYFLLPRRRHRWRHRLPASWHFSCGFLLRAQAWPAGRASQGGSGDRIVSEILIYALWPFQFPFMVTAMAIAVMVAVPTALLSCFLVLKGWSLMGDAISHAVLPGVVLAYIAGLPLGVGAFAAGMGCALSVGYLKENSRIKEDTVMGVVFSGLFGLGIVLYTSIQTDVHLDHILFGDILGISTADLIQTGIIGLVVTVLVLAKWRDLLLFTFDPQQAGAIGLPVRWLHYGLLEICR